ncbi:lipase 2 [Ilyonectria destructans]|nr:lipase 2 [Ilyonectria destructans]
MLSSLAAVLVVVLGTGTTFAGAHIFQPACSPPQVPTAQTHNGTYYGTRNSRHYIDHFLGIPFAQPPLGDLRLQHPQPLNTTWDGQRNATQFGYACVGFGEDTEMASFNYTNEDCLTLNIHRPAGYDETASLPIAVWIYGGGFVAGSALDPRYNLTFMVDESRKIGKPIIGVSISYRLGPYGWLYSEDIGNSMALHWIQDNIRGFGGDPNKVTIFGESAGSLSVGALLLPYKGRDDGLFRAAICESGSPWGLGIGNANQDESEALYRNLTARASCDDAHDKIACLRSIPAEDFEYLASGKDTDTPTGYVFSKSFSLLYGPQVDGDILVRDPLEQLQNGEFVKVPFLTGDTSDEGTAFTGFGLNTDQDVVDILAPMGLSNATIQELLDHYPYNNDKDLVIQGHPGLFNETIGLRRKQVASILTDLFFVVPRKMAVEAMVRHSSHPIFTYRWDTMFGGIADYYGVIHFSDAPFVFHSVEGTGYPGILPPYLGQNPFEGMGEAYLDLADLTTRMWVAFTHDLDPNSYTHPGPVWPQYSLDNATQLVFNAYNGTHVEGVFEKRSAATRYLMTRFYAS